MRARMPSEIRARQLLNETWYTFPRRDLGKGRYAGLVVVAFGLFFFGFGVLWMRPLLKSFLREDSLFRWFELLFILAGTPIFLIGTVILAFGFAILSNGLHAEVGLDRETLRYRERWGVLRWTWKRSLEDVERLVIGDRFASSNDALPAGAETDYQNPYRHWRTLRAEGESIKPMLLAPGYPREMLLAFAGILAREAGLGSAGLHHAGGTELAVVEEETAPPEDEMLEGYLPPQPSESNAEYRKHEQGLSILFPAQGAWKGSKGMMPFALFWNLIVGIIAGVMIVSMVEGKDDIPIFALVVIGVFVLIGVWALAYAVNLGHRHAAIAVDRHRIVVKRMSPFKSSEHTYRLDELAAIRVGNTNVSVNNVPIRELQIIPRQGETLGLLSQRDDDELEWAAALLRHHLGLPRTPSDRHAT